MLPWTLPAFLLVVLVLLLNEVLGRELGHGLRDDVEGVSARSYIILANVHVCAQKFLCQFLAERVFIEVSRVQFLSIRNLHLQFLAYEIPQTCTSPSLHVPLTLKAPP